MKKVKVMVAGLPGKMATLVASAVEKATDMELMDVALSEMDEELQLEGRSITLVPLPRHESVIKNLSLDIIVDFTVPGAVNRNAELYCQCGTPFVMGTTGGDRDLLVKTVEQSNISAVIAPNMAKQVVVFQAMMEFAAGNFPNAFKGYRLVITESHQQGKKDTSGTAKAIAKCFTELGVSFREDQIIMERDPLIQEVLWGVPDPYLTGHGYHNYTLLSEDGTVSFRFTHNINGRSVYVEGVLDAIRFSAKKKAWKGKVFSMVDVLSHS